MRRVRRLALAIIAGGVIFGTGSALTFAQTSTDGVDLSPNPEQCNQAPRSIEEVEALIASATPGSGSATTDPATFELPAGEEAPNEVRGGIVETIVQIIACGNGGDQLATLGGFTDAMLASQASSGLLGADPGMLTASPEALSEQAQTQLLDTREFTVYEDGRVGVLVYYREPAGQANGEAPILISLWVFAQEDGRWLLDEAVSGLEAQLGDVATPPAG